MKKALFPGTFDPPSLGHLDVIKRGTTICDQLYVGVTTNLAKKKSALFSTEEKVHMLKKICQDLPQVTIVSFSSLVIDFAKENGINFLIRGLRAFSDFEYEFRMALANRRMSGIETLFLMPDERVAHISSSLIREIGRYHSALSDFVPHEIEKMVLERISSHSQKEM
jgi:pantetheine-phosphate adenylyltransferase